MVLTDPDRFPDGISPTVTYPHGERPLYEYLEHHAETKPDKTAINFYGSELTFQELNTAVDTFASELAERGYGDGDTILLYLQNCPQFYIGYHAAHKLGMIVSPCNPMSKEHRVSYQLQDGSVEVALALDTFEPMMSNVRDETDLTDVIYTNLGAYIPADPTPAVHDEMTDAIEPAAATSIDRSQYLETILEERSATDPPTVTTAMDDVCLLQYTSGTTGLPKGCMHTYQSILFKAASVATLYDFDPSDRYLGVMPIFHVAGKLNTVDTPLIRGGTTILLTRYEPEAVMQAAADYEPTHFWLTTPMARDILEHPSRDEYDLTSFEYNPVSSFGETLTEDLATQWFELTGGKMAEGAYGLSETHTKDTFTRKLDTIEEGFVGLPSHGVDIVVRDWETHEEVPRGETGEISVKSPSVMEGYWEKPEETAEVFHDGYVLTGDIGRMTEDGILYFLGREKSMIKSSGYSISPAEVEAILKEHEAITNAAVFGREAETRGESVVAVLTTEGDLTEDDVLTWGKEHMAAYKRPRDVIILEEMPVTDMGKIDKELLKERYA